MSWDNFPDQSLIFQGGGKGKPFRMEVTDSVVWLAGISRSDQGGPCSRVPSANTTPGSDHGAIILMQVN